MLNSPAVQLFVHHAQQMHPRIVPLIAEMESIAKICQRLDDIPLAIELAAGRTESLGVEGVQRRPPESMCPIVYFDALRLKVRD